MPTSPTDDYLFAESAAGGDISDPAAKRTAGYLFEDPWPHEEANFMFRAIGRWIDFFKSSGGSYPSPQSAKAAGAGLSNADTFILAGSRTLLGSKSTLASTATSYVDADHDGEFFVTLEQGDGAGTNVEITVIDDTFETPIRTWNTGSDVANAAAIACNGEFIAVGLSTGDVEVFDYDGNSQFTTDHGGTLTDLCMDATQLYTVGAAAISTGGTNARETHAFTLATGAFAWESDVAHGAQLEACETDGVHVYVAGAADGVGDHAARVKTADGTLGLSTALTQAVTRRGRVQLGPRSVYFLTDNGTNAKIEEHHKNTMAAIATRQLEGNFMNIAVNHEHLFTVSANSASGVNRHEAYNANEDLGEITITGEPNLNVYEVYTSGHALFGLDNTNQDAVKLTAPRGVGVWEYTGTTPPARSWLQRIFIPQGH